MLRRARLHRGVYEGEVKQQEYFKFIIIYICLTQILESESESALFRLPVDSIQEQ